MTSSSMIRARVTSSVVPLKGSTRTRQRAELHAPASRASVGCRVGSSRCHGSLPPAALAGTAVYLRTTPDERKSAEECPDG
jgi:hypothetical protein